MKLSLTTVAAALAVAVSASPTTPKSSQPEGSKSWAGTSNYFVQGLSASDQEAYISALADAGVKVIRLWVSQQPGGGSCVKGSISKNSAPNFEEAIGTYNWETLDLLDQTLVYLEEKGIKALISPHDANLLNGPNGYVGLAFPEKS
jgi:mannan endo-1,4-beta-mannosidase